MTQVLPGRDGVARRLPPFPTRGGAHSFHRLMKIVLEKYHQLLKVLITVLMGVLIIPVTMQIASRYVGFIPRYIWTEEAARFCFVWIIMLGSMIAVRDGSHFDVDLLPHPKTPLQALLARLVVHFFMLLMAISFAWYGMDFAKFGWIQNSEMSGINMLSIYISFPLAGLTWAVFLIEKVVEDYQTYLKERQ